MMSLGELAQVFAILFTQLLADTPAGAGSSEALAIASFLQSACTIEGQIIARFG